MGLWSLWFWLVLVLLFEILFTKYITHVFSVVFFLIMLMAGLLFSFEFDLLASMVVLTYSSVFIILSLLLIQFSSLNGLSYRGFFYTYIYFWLFFFIVLWSNLNPVYMDYSSWSLSLLWQDMLSLNGEEFYFSGSVAHELLYKFFIFETIWANIFLILSFIVYSFLLKKRVKGNFFLLSKQASFLLNNLFWRKKWFSSQVRGINNVRRQTRRLNSSLILHKI